MRANDHARCCGGNEVRGEDRGHFRAGSGSRPPGRGEPVVALPQARIRMTGNRLAGGR